MPITSIPDHVAVAVPAIDTAATRWRDELGGGWAMPRFPLEDAGFATRQLRYRGDAKLELLEPLGPDTFAGRFVMRYGASIHHLTLKVPALLPAVQAVRDAGYDIVDVLTEGDIWHEAFLRPSQVGGMIVQLAWAGRSDAEWAELARATPETPAPDGAILRGPTLTNPDLESARTLWRLLGAEVDDHDGVLRAWWPGSPLDVHIAPGERAGSVGLRLDGSQPLEADAELGPATLAPRS